VSASILLVDDEPCALRYMALALADEFFQVRSATSGAAALRAVESATPDVVVSDLRMPGLDGLELIAALKRKWPDLPIIMVTVERDVPTIVEAVRLGAINFLVKPVAPEVLIAAVRRALAHRVTADLCDAQLPEIVGISPAIAGVRREIRLAARSDVNVLITGETGTGKELAARAIHRLSPLVGGPFVGHNCAATPPELFESQFFGHRRGAFTGADRDQCGLFEQAHAGVLFLDELECLGAAHQAKLLRVLDDGELRPVGAREAKRVSVRLLSATNRDPERLGAEGLLREDLYYRLRGMEIRLPPLRERSEDIPALVRHFLRGMGAQIEEEATSGLARHPWPGNVRELRNAVRGAAARAAGGTIGVGDLALGTSLGARERTGSAEPASLRQAEFGLIQQALDACAGNRTRAARALGIHRSTLRRKLREHGSLGG
jgi:DNA-binding NtrC family response regulator